MLHELESQDCITFYRVTGVRGEREGGGGGGEVRDRERR